MKTNWKTWAPVAVWLVLFLLPVPAGLNANQWRYFAIFAAVIAGLVLESMPVGAVGIIGLTFAALMGYVEKDPNKSLRWALSGFSESGLADRRRLHLRDRLPQKRARAADRAAARARAGQEDARARLRGAVCRSRARPRDAVQHRAQRRHDLPDRLQHSQDLRLRAGADGGQDRHLRHVDGLCRHGGDELTLPPLWRLTSRAWRSPRRRSASTWPGASGSSASCRSGCC